MLLKECFHLQKMTMENSNCRRFLATSTQWVEIDKKKCNLAKLHGLFASLDRIKFIKKIISNGGSLICTLYSTVVMLNYRAIFDTPHQYTCLTLPGFYQKLLYSWIINKSKMKITPHSALVPGYARCLSWKDAILMLLAH